MVSGFPRGGCKEYEIHSELGRPPHLIAITMDGFYCRYYVGSKGKHGHEFLEYELKPDGRLRYANMSKYRHEEVIRRQVKVTNIVKQEAFRIIQESGLLELSDHSWPKGDTNDLQELDLRIDGKTYKYSSPKVGSMAELKECGGSDELSALYYLGQDLKYLFASIISIHFKIRPT